MQDESRRADLELSRDAVATDTQRLLNTERDRLTQKLAAAEVQTALQVGDLATAGQALGRDWPQVQERLLARLAAFEKNA